MAERDGYPSGRKVLVISYLFPPEWGGGGVMRVVKFIKWLRTMGWEPVVLTVRRHDTFMPDMSILHEIEGVEIYRCGDYFREIIRYVLLKLTRAKKSLFGAAFSPSREAERHGGAVRKVLYDLICIPDECIGWILPAVIKGREIIKKEGISLVFTTCPPFSPHLVGYLLKKACQVPLVLDYRDRWVGSPLLDGYTSWRKRVNRRLERLIVGRCDYVVATTEGQANHFREEYGEERIAVIRNGYDEEDFHFEMPKRKNADKLVFSHIGRLTHGRSLEYFLEALDGLDEEVLADIEVNLIGTVSADNEAMIKKSRAGHTIKNLGSRTHQDALKMMFVSDVLVIIQFLEEDGFNAVPGKIFEYSRASKPVLAICPRNSEIWNLVTGYNLGICVDSTDSKGIGEAVLSLRKAWKSGTLTCYPSSPVIEEFDRRRQALQLAEIFDRIGRRG